MTDSKKPVRVDQVAWAQLFPWLAIFKTFRMAIRPSKLAVALVMLILLFVLGHGLDVIWGPQAIPGEVSAFGRMSQSDFKAWKKDQIGSRDGRLQEILRSAYLADLNTQVIEKVLSKPNKYMLSRALVGEHFDKLYDSVQGKAVAQIQSGADQSQVSERLAENLKRVAQKRRNALNKLTELEPMGIFRATFEFKVNAFDQLVQSAIGFRFGFSHILDRSQKSSDTVVGALREMLYTLPSWLYGTYPGFLSLLSVCMLLIVSFFGGILARLAAVDAAGSAHTPVMASIRFVLRRYLWFVLTPLMPVIMISVLGLLLMLGGLVFFNLPGLDILGGFLFFVALLLGFGITILLVFTMATYPMFYPALVMEGTDSFDVVSRCFGYLVARPWHWFFYTMLSLVYGAVGYLFFGGLIYLTLSITHQLVGMGVFAQMVDEGSRWNAIMPTPRLGQLLYSFNWVAGLGFTGKVTAGMIWVWSFFLVSLIGAYTGSFFYCANTVIYQLLRQSSEQTSPDEIAIDPIEIEEPQAPSSQQTPDKVDEQSADSQ
ncbi:MAG: hypothetical protein JKX85_01740 [Phycisphaeraceae bacterium]|nr:hypothetical protein [Phycisphaeraceae bacterium]